MKRSYTKQEIEQFWVGLIDSDGSVQCNHWRKKVLQYRIVIKMHIDNIEMLQTIQKGLGGGSVRTVSVSKKEGKQEAIWVENHQRRIWKLLEIFERYPPLTTRVQSQIAFLKQCRAENDVSWMLNNRENKYNAYTSAACVHELHPKNIISLHYFPIWCSGFITGEGCFSFRKDHNVKSFSIAQKHDKYLIEAIRDFFGGVNKVRPLKDEMYVWEIYRIDVLKRIFAHCEMYPLLGKKKIQLSTFISALNL